jgi:multiple sugar transport system substrate-binding protein
MTMKIPFNMLLLATMCLASWSCGSSPRLVVQAPEGPIANALIQYKPCPLDNPDCFQVVSVPYEELYANAESDIVQGNRTSESADLYLLDDAWVAGFREELLHLDLPIPKPQFQEALKSRWTDGVRYWAIPLMTNFQLLFRKGLKVREGETWSDLVKATRESNSSASFVLRGRSNYALTNDFLPILWAFGGELKVSEKSASLSPETNALAAIHALRELARSGPAYEQRLSTDGLRIELEDRMGVMAIEWSAAAKQLNVAESKWSRIPCSGESAKHPSKAPPENCNGAGVLSAWMLAAPKTLSGEKLNAAVDLFQYLTDPKASQSLCQLDAIATTPPTPTNCVETDTFDFYVDDTRQQSGLSWQFLGIKKLLPGKVRPDTPYWHAIDERIGNALSQSLLGLQDDEKESLKELNVGLKKLVSTPN